MTDNILKMGKNVSLIRNRCFSKQRRIKHRRAERPPPRLNFLGVCLCITRICFNCSHHAMFTICTLFSSLTTKHKVCVKGIKTNLRPQEVYRAGTAPPGFEIPGSASAKDIIPVMLLMRYLK